MAFEASRILHRLGCEVRVFDPSGLPVKDDVQHHHAKVQELRQLSEWSEAQFWSSPEQHGNITAVMKNQSEENLSVQVPQSRTLMSRCDLPPHTISRLDSTLHWIGSTDSRENVGFRAGGSWGGPSLAEEIRGSI
jgi:hypothetical protein